MPGRVRCAALLLAMLGSLAGCGEPRRGADASVAILREWRETRNREQCPPLTESSRDAAVWITDAATWNRVWTLTIREPSGESAVITDAPPVDFSRSAILACYRFDGATETEEYRLVKNAGGFIVRLTLRPAAEATDTASGWYEIILLEIPKSESALPIDIQTK